MNAVAALIAPCAAKVADIVLSSQGYQNACFAIDMYFTTTFLSPFSDIVYRRIYPDIHITTNTGVHS